MLNQLLQALTGSTQIAAYTYPGANLGGNVNVPLQATFGNILSNTYASLSSNPFSGLGGLPMIPGQQGYAPQGQNLMGATQAYNNVLRYMPTQSSRTPGHKREALTPGAVVNTLLAPPQPTNAISPALQIAAGLNPLQGFAGQGGGLPSTYSQTGLTNQFYPGSYMSPASMGQGKGGMLQTLIGPMLGLFGLLKSFLGLRKEVSSLQPISNPADGIRSYENSLSTYAKMENTDGAFDEDYWGEMQGNEDYENGRYENAGSG